MPMAPARSNEEMLSPYLVTRFHYISDSTGRPPEADRATAIKHTGPSLDIGTILYGHGDHS